MAYIAPVHQPSSIRHALKLNFLAPDEQCLVVAKANRLEIYAQTQDGLSLQHSRTIYGRITMLEKLRPASSATDHLFVGTDHFMYFTLSWHSATKSLHTERKYVDTAEKMARDSQTGDRCNIDPSRSFMALELYEGIMTIIPFMKKQRKESDIEIGALGSPVQTRIPEMFVRSSAFVQTRTLQRDNKPRIVLLHQNASKRVKLKMRQVNFSSGLTSDDPGSVELEDVKDIDEEEAKDSGASHVIPVPGPAYGYLVLGEVSITYFEPFTQRPCNQPLEEATFFVAWEQIDHQRFVLADEYGKLYLLMLELTPSNEVTGWKLDVIGETSRASVLIYLGEGRLFIGSHQGDSQLVVIKPQAFEVIQTLDNIAPIVDFTIMDMGGRGNDGGQNEYSSGQARLVTGSGAYRDGSLRSVRSGVGLEDLGLLDSMANITSVQALKSNEANTFDDVLLVSFIDESRVFRFGSDGDIEELSDFAGLTLDKGSFFASNVNNNHILQATDSTVRITDLESSMVTSEWTSGPGQAITAVTANDDIVVVSVGGSELLVLEIHNSLHVRARRGFPPEAQIACVNVSPSSRSFCAIGTWGSSAISILSLQDLSIVYTEKAIIEEATVPRELLLASILDSKSPTLFVAMADGQVITHALDPTTGALSGRKSTVLGTQQATFRALPRGNGLHNVFATCTHPSLIYGSEGRIVFAAVTATEASCVCPLNAEAYPACLAIASPSDLKLALVDEERSTNVEGLHVGETVRRIAYSSELKSFGLGTIKRSLVRNEEVVESHFKLADEQMFRVLDVFPLNQHEIVESAIRAELNDGSGGLAERFIVGTAYLDDSNSDSIRGRIIIFEVTEDRDLRVVYEHSLKGACRCLAMLGGNIVAGLIKTVVVFSLDYETSSTPFLTKRASYRCSTAPIDIAVDGDRIAITDLMKSLTIVQYRKSPEKVAYTLSEIARHFQTVWGTAVASVAEHTYLESDAEGNLFVLQQDVNGVTSEDKRRLQITSEICLGELVNKIRRIEVTTAGEAAVTPRAFIGTTEGSIHLFGLIKQEKLNLLIELQNILASYVQSPGYVPFNAYRAVRNMSRMETDPFRFIDGELIEHFVNLDDDLQEELVVALNKNPTIDEDVESIRSMVETLRRLR